MARARSTSRRHWGLPSIPSRQDGYPDARKRHSSRLARARSALSARALFARGRFSVRRWRGTRQLACSEYRQMIQRQLHLGDCASGSAWSTWRSYLCSTAWVSAVVASLIAVAGTLLGASSTYWFQQRAAQRAEITARQERLRQDQLAACSAFAAAVTDLRRALIAVWFHAAPPALAEAV